MADTVKIVGGGDLDGAVLQGAATEATLLLLVKQLGGAGSATGAKVANIAGKNPNLKSVNDLAKESKGLVDEFKNLKEQHETLSGASKLFAAQLIVGSDKFANYTAAFTGYMAQFGEGFALLAKGIQLLVNQIDNQIVEFRKLSMVGADFGNSIFDSRYAAINAGLSLEEFSGQVQSNSKMLALLGGSTTAGARRFQSISREIQLNSQPVFSKLGITMNETNDLMTDYLDIQTSIGRGQKMSNAQLVQGTKNYIMELDLLSRITGISRKELAEEQKRLSIDPSFQSVMASMGKDAAENMSKFVSGFKDSPAIQAGFKDLFTFDGGAITEEGQRLQNIFGAEIVDLVRKVKDNSISLEEANLVFNKMTDSANNVSDAEKLLIGQLIAGKNSQFIVNAELLRLGNRGAKTAEAIKQQEEATRSGQKAVTDFSSQITKFTNALITLFKPLIEFATNGLAKLTEFIGGITASINGLGKLEQNLLLVTGALGTIIGTMLAYKAGKAVVGGAKNLLVGGGSNPASEVLTGLGKNSGIGAGLKGLAAGLKAFGGVGSVAIIKGAGVLALVIGILGGGAFVGLTLIAAGFALTGMALSRFATGLGEVAAIDGANLKSVASGAKELAMAMGELAGGGLKQGLSNIFTLGKGGPKEFAKNLNSALDSLDKSKIESYTVALNNLSTSFSGLNNNMSKGMSAANKSSTDKMDELNMTMKNVLAVLETGTRYSKQTASNTMELS